MSIDSTPLDLEIRRVLDSKFSPNLYSYSAQFKIGDKTVDTIKILDIDEQADYELSYGTVIMMNVVVMLGDYSRLIYPCKDNLELILKVEKLNYMDMSPTDQEESVEVLTYNVSLDPQARPYMSEDTNDQSLSREVQNLLDFVELSIQLKPKLLDAIKDVSVGGQFIRTTNADVIRNAITLFCGKLELNDDEKLLGVDIHPTAATDVKESVVVKHGVMLSDLADYVQRHTGGVFPSGMAQFVHERNWYVYPPYDTSGFDESNEKMVIVAVPAKRYPQVEKTYIRQHGITTVLSTGGKRIVSDKSQIQDNAGNGVMFTDANRIIDGFTQGGNNTSIVKRGQSNSEFIGEQREDGQNNVRMSPEGITANPYLATSRLARSQGHFYTLEWENADHKLIRPGLNVKIQYLDEGEVKEVDGVLLKSHRHTKQNGKGLLASGYRTFIAMVIFVKAADAESSGLLGLS